MLTTQQYIKGFRIDRCARHLNAAENDSFALSEALAAVVHGKASDEILNRYSELRRKTYHEVILPISSESLRLVFNRGPGSARERPGALRGHKNDPEAMRTSCPLQRHSTPLRWSWVERWRKGSRILD
jgi:2-polyprenyl-6-methoxyphenol hydroxylase-like FAD-dependent oxidoreductase